MEPMKTVTLNGQQFEIVDAEARQEIQDIVVHGGDKTYTYEQSTPSALWTVNHNLNKIPAITVIDSAGNEVVGNYNHTDENNTVLEFSGAFAGKAHFN